MRGETENRVDKASGIPIKGLFTQNKSMKDLFLRAQSICAPHDGTDLQRAANNDKDRLSIR
jgi:hypothetical protein